jgi:hypothetical protein
MGAPPTQPVEEGMRTPVAASRLTSPPGKRAACASK